jgi:hypothetical protein
MSTKSVQVVFMYAKANLMLYFCISISCNRNSLVSFRDSVPYRFSAKSVKPFMVSVKETRLWPYERNGLHFDSISLRIQIADQLLMTVSITEFHRTGIAVRGIH